MTLDERIGELIIQHGGLRLAARELRIDAGYLSRLLSGLKTAPSPKTLEKLGLRRVVSYERTHGGQK